jgi:hypothetical protein
MNRYQLAPARSASVFGSLAAVSRIPNSMEESPISTPSEEVPCSSRPRNSQRAHNVACSLKNYLTDVDRIPRRNFCQCKAADCDRRKRPSPPLRGDGPGLDTTHRHKVLSARSALNPPFSSRQLVAFSIPVTQPRFGGAFYSTPAD